ncbi:hypothetical protein H4S08_001761 [Coemansia sp. RSA 1365]|nr:hypothetical protein H4S08_001761 [Coemansia sp. RSA 1365]
MVTGIPKELAEEQRLRQHFETGDGLGSVVSVEIVPRIERLGVLVRRRSRLLKMIEEQVTVILGNPCSAVDYDRDRLYSLLMSHGTINNIEEIDGQQDMRLVLRRWSLSRYHTQRGLRKLEGMMDKLEIILQQFHHSDSVIQQVRHEWFASYDGKRERSSTVGFSPDDSFQIGSTSRELINERCREAADVRENSCFYSVSELSNLTQPQSIEAQGLAAKIIEDVHSDLEKYILEWRSHSTNKKQTSMERLQQLFSNASRYKKTDKLAHIIAEWASFNYKDVKSDSEDVLRLMFAAFATFVNIYLERHNTSASRVGVQTRSTYEAVNLSATVPRLLRSGSAVNSYPCGVNGKLRAKNALLLCYPDPDKKGKFVDEHADVVAYAEIGYSLYDLDESIDRILLYSRNLFTRRPNRRFAWGLAGIITQMHACLMLHDAVLVSPSMDVSKSYGRREFIELIVNWSLCDEVQLGFDPTIRFDHKSCSYIMDCFDDSKGPCAPPQQYRLVRALALTLSVQGRHTRCYLAVPHKDEDNNSDNEGSCDSTVNNEEEVIIKDAWNGAQSPLLDDNRSEIRLLRTITEELESDSVDVDFLYPKLLMGGHVRVKINGVEYLDSTDLIFKLLGVGRVDRDKLGHRWFNDFYYGNMDPVFVERWRYQHLRAHRRIVMTPVAEKIETLNSEEEAVVVFADAMRCHSAIYKHCSILHRDISLNNIMVVRDNNGGLPRGLLIDFDIGMDINTISADDEPRDVGTLPFMSITALENLKVPRTALDDWESLLYLICWTGTYNTFHKKVSGKLMDISCNSERRSSPCISCWDVHPVERAAEEKRLYMASLYNFKYYILRYFREENKHLYDLALDIYRALFLHEGCSGTDCMYPDSDSDSESEKLSSSESLTKYRMAALSPKLRRNRMVDPLKERVKYEEDIVMELERIMKMFREKIYNSTKVQELEQELTQKKEQE